MKALRIGRQTLVCEDYLSSPCYTRAEWKTQSSADYELDASGNLLFQGRVQGTGHGWRRVAVPAWARD